MDFKAFFVACLSAAMTIAGMILVTVPILAQEGQPPEDGRIIIGTGHDYPPYSFLGEQGEPTGFNVELTRAIAEATGLDVEIDYRSWGEIRPALESGEIDAIAGMFYSVERDKVVDFTPPYAIVHHAIFAREGALEIETEGGLRRKELIVMQGDIMHDYVMESGLSERPVLVKDPAEALQLLASGRHDYALIAKLPALYWSRELELSNIVTIGPLLRPSRYCFAVKEGSSELLFRLSEGLAMVKESGRFAEIWDEWLGTLEPEELRVRDVLRYAAVVLIPLLGLLVVVVLWMWSLRTQVARRTADLGMENAVRRRAEDALRESERVLLESQSVAQIGSYVFDIPARGWKGSSVLDRIFGIDEDHERSVKGWLAIIHPDDRQPMIHYFVHDVAKGHGSLDIEYRIVRHCDGIERWVLNLGRVEFDARDEPYSMVGTIQDITEHKQAEEALSKKMKELEVFNDAAVGRELKVNELRTEVNGLLRQMNREPKYQSAE